MPDFSIFEKQDSGLTLVINGQLSGFAILTGMLDQIDDGHLGQVTLKCHGCLSFYNFHCRRMALTAVVVKRR